MNGWLTNSELHKNFGPLFNSDMPDAVKEYHRKRVLDRFCWMDAQLEGKQYIMGDTFTVADAYLFVVAGWGRFVGVDLSVFSNLAAVIQNIAARPAVQQTLKAEGLV